MGILGRSLDASSSRKVPATLICRSASGLALAVLGTVAQARWNTPEQPSTAARHASTGESRSQATNRPAATRKPTGHARDVPLVLETRHQRPTEKPRAACDQIGHIKTKSTPQGHDIGRGRLAPLGSIGTIHSESHGLVLRVCIADSRLNQSRSP